MRKNRISIGRYVVVFRDVPGAVVATVYDSAVIVQNLIDFTGDRNGLLRHIEQMIEEVENV